MWRENIDTVEFFQIISDQWRLVAGFGGIGFLALDYPAVESAMNMHGVPAKKRRQLFSNVRLMAAAALPLLNKKKKTDG